MRAPWILVMAACAACVGARADGRTARFAGARIEGMTLAAVWGAAADERGDPRVIDVITSPDGRWAVVGGARLELVDAATGAVRQVLARRQHISGPGQMSFSADGRRFAVIDGEERGCVAVWDLEVPRARELRCVPVPDAPGLLLALSPDGGAAVTWDHFGRLARRELATGVVTWRAAAPRSEGPRKVLQWLAGDVVLTGTAMTLSARDAANGDVRWQSEVDVDHALGRDGDRVAVLGDSGLAWLTLADGEVTIANAAYAAWGRSHSAHAAVLMPDLRMVTIDARGRATVERDGRVIDRFRAPSHIDHVAAAGTTLWIVADGRVSRWDGATGRRLEHAAEPLGPVIAVAADDGRVIAGSTDGALVIWRRDGAVLARHRTRARACGRWTFSPARRWAVCEGVDPEGDLVVPPLDFEWFALDGRRGSRALKVRRAQPLFWLDEDTLATPDVITRRLPASGHAGELDAGPPRFAASVDGDELAIAGFVTPERPPRPAPRPSPFFSSPPPSSYDDFFTPPPAPRGLAVWRSRESRTMLDGDVAVTALAAAPDTIALAGDDQLQLWRRPTAIAPWRPVWTAGVAPSTTIDAFSGVPHPAPVDLLALSPDARWLAVAESHGNLITIRDTRTGTTVASLDLAGSGTVATALVFHGRYVFVGTQSGRLLELRIR